MVTISLSAEDAPPTQQELLSLAEQIRNYVRKYVVLVNDETLDMLVLWAMHTHVYRYWDTTPYLEVVSVTYQSGKTRLFEVLEQIVHAPMRTDNITPAGLFHAIEGGDRTLLMDEMDADTVQRALTQVINSGFRRGGTITRLNRGETVEYSTFCPKAFAGIGTNMAGPTRDRSIQVYMHRKSDDEHVERFLYSHAKRETRELKLGLERFRMYFELPGVLPSIPNSLSDRQLEMWEPLFAIAALLGKTWIHRVTAASKTLTTKADFEEPDPRIQLLGDIYTLLVDLHAPKRILTSELLTKLQKSETNYQGRALDNAKSLAMFLTPFGVSPKMLRIGNTQGRGYEVRDFHDAFKRYLRLDPPQAPGKTPAKAPSKPVKASKTRTTRTTRTRAVKGTGRKLSAVPTPTFTDGQE